MTEERWFTVAEISDHLGIQKETVYGWINRRGLPAHRVGRFWRFKLQEIDHWVRSGQAADAGEITGEKPSSKP